MNADRPRPVSIVRIATPGIGDLAMVRESRRLHREITVERYRLKGEIADAKTGKAIRGSWWRALDKETDTTTGATIIRHVGLFELREDALAIAEEWKGETVRRPESKKLPSLPPADCNLITGTDRKETADAQLKALRRQYPATFAAMAALKAAPEDSELRERVKDAYLADAARRLGDLDGRLGEVIYRNRLCADVVRALADALKAHKRRRKDQTLVAVDHHLTFRWHEDGLCFLNAAELASRINSIFETMVTAKAITRRRESLGLLTNRRTGPRPEP